MFSGNFAQGFITGLADSVNKELQDDMDMFEKKKSRLGDLAIEKSLTEQTRFNQEKKDNLKQIKVMAATLDTDADTIQYIYEKTGSVEAASVYVDQLKKMQNAQGGRTLMPINKMLGLEQRTEGKTTALQLANYITTPVQKYDLSAAGDIRPGFMKFFGSADNAMASLQSEVSAMEGIAGVGNTSTQDIPAAISGRGVYEWQLSMGGNPATDYANAGAIVAQLAMAETEATDETAKKAIRDEANAAKSAQLISANKLTLIENRGKRLSTNETQDVRKRSVTDLAQFHGVSGGADEYSLGIWIGNNEKTQQMEILSAATDTLMVVYDEAAQAGINPTHIENIMANARRTLRVPVVKNGILYFPDDPETLFDITVMGGKNKQKPLFNSSPRYKGSVATTLSPSVTQVLNNIPPQGVIKTQVAKLKNANSAKVRKASANSIMAQLRVLNNTASKADLDSAFLNIAGMSYADATK